MQRDPAPVLVLVSIDADERAVTVNKGRVSDKLAIDPDLVELVDAVIRYGEDGLKILVLLAVGEGGDK